MKKVCIIFSIVFFLLSISKTEAKTTIFLQKERSVVLTDSTKKTPAKKIIKVTPYQNPDKSWGYEISVDGKKYVNQPHIPAIPGTKGFATEADAKKCGAVMKRKIEKNIMPPTVEIKDLDSLKIKYK